MLKPGKGQRPGKGKWARSQSFLEKLAFFTHNGPLQQKSHLKAAMEEKAAPTPMLRADPEVVVETLGAHRLKNMLRNMLLIRQFEARCEASYLQGKIGGFLHLYSGQEAIQTAALEALGPKHWYSASYRCHALALLLGETPRVLMAELFGRATGNAKGRGGSMHLYSDRLLGGFGIVGGQVPIATGAAFSCKYLEKTEEISVCFLGDGAVAQGVFHEALNLASLWSLPCLYIVENNHWSMGTPPYRTLADPEHFLQKAAASYNIDYFRLDGLDVIQSYGGFCEAYQTLLSKKRPVLVECMTERFKGHSISDPGLYRTKEALQKCLAEDPIPKLVAVLQGRGWLTEEEYASLERTCYEEVSTAAQQAEHEPWPEVSQLEEGVYADT